MHTPSLAEAGRREASWLLDTFRTSKLPVREEEEEEEEGSNMVKGGEIRYSGSPLLWTPWGPGVKCPV